MKENKSKNQRKKNSGKHDTVVSITVLVLVAVFIIGALLYNSGMFTGLMSGFASGDRQINMASGKTVKSTDELDGTITENDSIAYPGYGELDFQAGKKKQDVYLSNPEENTCYFSMSLYLEDGTLIWQSSGYLAPGNAYDRIELTKALEEGTYENATLQYESYSIKDGRQLNGSSINMTINVEG